MRPAVLGAVDQLNGESLRARKAEALTGRNAGQGFMSIYAV
jgi:hypothetical protein